MKKAGSMPLSYLPCHSQLEKLGGSIPLNKTTSLQQLLLCRVHKNFLLFSLNSEVIQHSHFKMRNSLKTYGRERMQLGFALLAWVG